MIYFEKEVMIRPLKKEDLVGDYLIWMNDPIVTKYNSHGLFPQSDEELKQFIQSLNSKNNITWAIIFKKEHIGNVSLQSINWVNRSGELAIFIGNTKLYKKGIATIVCNFVINHGFNKLNLHRIWTGTAATNVGMRKVAEKLGMINEGIFRDGTFLEGKYVDVYSFGILREEWNNEC